MFVVDVKAVSSNGLLARTPVPIIYTILDYQAGLAKGSRFTGRIGLPSFPFGSFLLWLVYSYRCWSSPAKPTRKFWKLCDNAGVKCRLDACLHVKTTSHLRGWFTNGTFLSQLISFEGQFFLHSVFNALSRGSLFRIGLFRTFQTCVITWKFSWKFSSFLDRSNCFAFFQDE